LLDGFFKSMQIFFGVCVANIQIRHKNVKLSSEESL